MEKLTEKEKNFMKASTVFAYDAGNFALKAVGAEEMAPDAGYSDRLEEYTRAVFADKAPEWVNGVVALKGTGKGHEYAVLVDISTSADDLGVEYRVTVTRDDGKVFDADRLVWDDKSSFCASFVVSGTTLLLATQVGENLTQEEALHMMWVADIIRDVYNAVDSEFLGLVRFACSPTVTNAGVPVLILAMAYPKCSNVAYVVAGTGGLVLAGVHDSAGKGDGLYSLHSVTSPEDVLRFLAVVYQDAEAVCPSSKPC